MASAALLFACSSELQAVEVRFPDLETERLVEVISCFLGWPRRQVDVFHLQGLRRLDGVVHEHPTDALATESLIDGDVLDQPELAGGLSGNDQSCHADNPLPIIGMTRQQEESRADDPLDVVPFQLPQLSRRQLVEQVVDVSHLGGRQPFRLDTKHLDDGNDAFGGILHDEPLSWEEL